MENQEYPADRTTLWFIVVGLGVLWLAMAACLVGFGGEGAVPLVVVLVLVGAIEWLQVSNLRRKGPRLVLSEKGLLDPTFKVGTIPWTEIVDARYIRLGRKALIHLVLRDPDAWIERLSFPWNQLAAFANRTQTKPFCISTAEIKGKSREIHASIQARIQAARPTTPEGRIATR